MTITEALDVLARCGRGQDDAFHVLAGNDSQEVLPVTPEHVASVLMRFAAGEISQDDLEDWAMLLEARDEFDCGSVEDYLYALNNPELMGGISIQTVASMAELLQDQIAG